MEKEHHLPYIGGDYLKMQYKAVFVDATSALPPMMCSQ